ncbi:MAG TPA: hypothetical protein VMV73_04945 [Candidatus Dormibacteraeota bacterium]|nr:hypothetical protein [Candidatus Dormibacteraeota bacterium]
MMNPMDTEDPEARKADAATPEAATMAYVGGFAITQLGQQVGTISARVDRIDAKLDTAAVHLDAKIETFAARLDSKIDIVQRESTRHFRWSIALLVTIIGLVITTASHHFPIH